MSEFFREDIVHHKTGFIELLRRLWPHFLKQKRRFATVVVAVILLGIVGRLLPTLVGYVIDHGILRKDMSVVSRVAILYLFLEGVRSFLLFFHNYTFDRMGNRILFDVREQLISHVQALPIPFFDKTPAGRIVTRLTNDVVGIGELFNQGLITIATSSFSLVMILVAMLLISVKLTLITLVVFPVVLYISFRLSNHIHVVLRESKRKLAIINAFVAECISGIKVLQLYNRLERANQKFMGLSGSYREVQLKAVRLYAMLWPTTSFFNAITLATALYYGGYLRAEGEIQVGMLIAFFMHIQDFLPPLRNILEKYQILQNSLTSAERIFTLLDEKAEDLEGQTLPAQPLRGRIEFRAVRFRYGVDLPYALDGVNFVIEPGQSVAVVGKTGSGKSTLVALMQRFYDVSEGEIFVDGESLKDIARREIRARVSVVQQDNYIFRGTIGGNINLEDERVEAGRIRQAAARAYCSDMIRRRADGLGAKVEERGANFSAGERQLLAFARVLAFDPDILVLDEATANIDSQSEAHIQEATRQAIRGRTSLIIAHRLSTILDCDKILVMDAGKVVEQGSHAELMAMRGRYFALYTTQFQGASRLFATP